MYGKGLVSGDGMNAHKTMAGAGDKGNFGVKPLPQRSVPHPDVKMGHMPMDDSARGAGPGLMSKGSLAKQAAPQHGPQYDHFGRDGKA